MQVSYIDPAHKLMQHVPYHITVEEICSYQTELETNIPDFRTDLPLLLKLQT